MSKNKVQIEIDVDTLKGIREISKLQLEMQGLSKEADIFRKQADKASKALEKFTIADRNAGNAKWVEAHKKYHDAINQYTQLTDKVQNYNKSIDFQVSKLGLAGLSMRELNKYIAEQNTQWNKAKRGSEEYMLALDKLGKAETERNLRNKDRKDAIGVFSSAKSSTLGSLATGVGLSAGFIAANFAADMLFKTIGKVTEKVEGIDERADGISNLKIAIKGTTEEALALDAQIAKLDNRLDQTERRSIAIEAANLGVPTSQVVAYTQAIAEATIAMKKDFPEGSEQITNSFTKIKGLFKDTKDLEFPESVRAIGSSIKGLADDGIATAKWASDFTLRLGALDEKIRPTITQVLGLGAVLEQSGFTSEIAASGVTNVLTNAFKNTEILARFFGQSKKAFEEFINANPNEFLLQLAQRLKSLSGTQQAQLLKAFGNDAQEVSKILGTLNKKIDEVKESQAKANQYFQEGSRQVEIYAEKNENAAGKIQRALVKLGNWISSSKIYENIGKIIGGFADITGNLFDTTTQVDKSKTAFDNQTTSVKNLNTNIKPLLDKYDKLNVNSIEAARNQDEIKTIIEKLRAVLPSSVMGWNDYGEAIGVATGQARDFILVQEDMLKKQKGVLTSDYDKEYSDVQKKIENAKRLLRGIHRDDRVTGKPIFERTNRSITDFGVDRLISDDEYKKEQTALNVLIKRSSELKSILVELKSVAPTALAEVVVTGKRTGKTQKELDDEARAQAIIDEANKKAKSQAERDAEARKENARKDYQDLAKIQVAAIKDDYERKVATLSVEFNLEDENRQELVKKNQYAQEDYLKWRKRAYEGMLAQVKNLEEENDEEIAKKAKEALTKSIVRRLENHKDEETAKLKLAKESGDLFQVYLHELEVSNSDLQIDLTKATEEEKDQIIRRYATERDALFEKYVNDSADRDLKASKKALEAKAELLQIQIRQADEAGDIQKSKALELELSTVKEKIELNEASEAQITLIKEKYALEREEIEKKGYKRLLDKVSFWLTQYSTVSNAFFDFQAQQYQNQLTREDNLFNKKIANLEAQKNKGIISEREYTRKKTAFETEHDKKTREIKNKAAQADKIARISQAVMTVAQAVLSAWAAPWPFNVALPAVAAISGGLQVAAISNTEVPQYYDGEETHTDKGPGIDGKGGRVAIVHPNEYIMNARATANPKFAAIKPILQSLNRGTDLPSGNINTVNNNQSTVNQSPDSAIILKAAEMIVESANMLAEASQNITAEINWDYNTHRDLDRSRKKYEKSNANSFVES